MDRHGYIEKNREIAQRPPGFSLTWRGVLKNLEEMGQLRRIQVEVEEAIVNRPNAKQSEIATEVNHSPMTVAAIIDMLEARGDIRVNRTVDGNVAIAQVTATLRRRVKEVDY